MDDPFSLSESELITYLTELGVDDAVTMDPNERMRTMLTLMGGDDSTIPRDPPVNPNYHRMENTVAPVSHQPPAQLDGHTDAMDTPAENPNLGLDSAQMDEHVASYCSITGSDPESARHLLEALDWDLDAAVTMHMDHEHGDDVQNVESSASESDMSNFTGRMNASPMMPNFMGMPMGSAMMGGMQINGNAMNGNMQQHTYFQSGENDDDDEYGDYNGGASYRMNGMQGFGPNGPGGSSWAGSGGRAGKADEYDDEGIRKPDPIRHERMIGGMDDFDPYSRADTAEVTWLFPPPRHLSYSGSFQEAKMFAKDDKKWMLVNIQSHLEFSSQMMNRDTFVDETVITLLRTSFVFWQRGHTSPDAQNYMRTHSVEEDDLPHIAVIDSRTGAKIVTMKGFISPGDLAMALLEFLEDNNFENTKAPKQRNIDATRDFERQVALAEGRTDYNGDERIPFDNDQETKIQKTNGYSTEDSGKSEYNFASKVAEVKNVPVKTVEAVSSGGLKLSGDQKSPSVPNVQVDYGTVTAEPPTGDDPNVVRVSVKLPWGKQIVRRFRKDDLVRNIFAFANSLILEKEGAHKSFDLCTAYPSMSLRDNLTETIEAAGVSGSQVILRYDA